MNCVRFLYLHCIYLFIFVFLFYKMFLHPTVVWSGMSKIFMSSSLVLIGFT